MYNLNAKHNSDFQANEFSKQMTNTQSIDNTPSYLNPDSIIQMSQSQQPKNATISHRTPNRPIKTKKNNSINKNKIQWNHSAQAWARYRSPAHSIPKSKRFKESDPVCLEASALHPQLHINLRSKLLGEDKGVSFAKSIRPTLFPVAPNPSPQRYEKKRYLESCVSNRLEEKFNGESSRVNPEGQVAQSFYHIKGGAINKFQKPQLLYYPYTKKLQYNDRLIQAQRELRKMEERKNFGHHIRKKVNRSFKF